MTFISAGAEEADVDDIPPQIILLLAGAVSDVCRLQTADCGLQTADYTLHTVDLRVDLRP